MEAVQIVFHIINLILFCVCGLHYYLILKKLVELPDETPIGRRHNDIFTNLWAFKIVGYAVCGSAIALCAVFVGLQMDWVFKAHNQAVGDATSWAWLLFDYALATYMITIAVMGNVLLKWRGSSPACEQDLDEALR